MILVSNGNKDKKWGSGNNRAALSSLYGPGPIKYWAASTVSQDRIQLSFAHPEQVGWCSEAIHTQKRNLPCPVSAKAFLPQASPNNEVPLRCTTQSSFFPFASNEERESTDWLQAITSRSENISILSVLPYTFQWCELWATAQTLEHYLVGFSC